MAIEGGLVTGMRSWGERVQVYKRIPFAAVPTGANRVGRSPSSRGVISAPATQLEQSAARSQSY